MATDARDGFIPGGHVTPANRADTVELERVMEDLDLLPETVVLADKGYCSRKNRDMLKQRGLHDGIMQRALRGRALSPEAMGRNRMISRLRYMVEDGFGTLKRRYHFQRARYVGRIKTEMHARLKVSGAPSGLQRAVGSEKAGETECFFISIPRKTRLNFIQNRKTASFTDVFLHNFLGMVQFGCIVILLRHF